ncbi:MAG: hypothetical protein CL609_01135 [Anaerolineaceae bacterium]|nr:hypothetical protein [Anaerolineaceae bacterium]
MPSTHQNRYETYQSRLKRLEIILSRLKKADQRFFWLRMGIFFGGWLVTFAVSYLFPGFGWIFAAVGSVLAFVIVVFYHRRLDEIQLRYASANRWFSSQVARLTYDWQQLPSPPVGNLPADHPFARDLNLVGPKSLLHLIDTCTTQGGHSRLQNWLCYPDLEADKIRYRQEVLQEMVYLPGFRNRLMLISQPNSENKKEDLQAEKILKWLESGIAPTSLNTTLIVLLTLVGVNLILLFLWLFQIIPAFWQFGLILYMGIYLFQYQQFKSLFHDAMTLGKVLQQFQLVLNFLEKYPYPAGSKLGQIASRLKQPGKSPSIILKKVSRLISAASLQNNQILTLIVNAIIPWDLIFARQLSSYKQTIHHLLPDWLDTWYEIEALNALANFSYLFPEYQFAEFINTSENADEMIFEAKQMGHPLIPMKTRVCNDFGLTAKGQVVIVTGSNMSGKSTFLRTVGINTALALAGAVVPAASLRLQVVRLFTCIQVSDSLNDGFSYFYAEVFRLKQLLDALQIGTQPPVLFLIDEIFRGTNNQERRIGSQAYVRALTKANGAGLISTHDLELSKLAEEDGDILNYNFRDDVVDGRMAFDYILRTGPSPTTNALKIMKLEGLPVE